MKLKKLKLLALLVFLFSGLNAETYHWVGSTAGGLWHVAANWFDQTAGTSNIPGINDTVIFNTGTQLIIGLDWQFSADANIMYITNSTSVSLYEPSTEVANLSVGSLLEIDVGSDLKITTTGQPITVNCYGNADIYGSVILGNGGHQLLCFNTGYQIHFYDGATFISDVGLTAYPFGDSGSNENSVIFDNGSNYYYYDGFNPFGFVGSGTNITVFYPESNFYIMDSDGSLIQFSGKTYGNIINNSGNNIVVVSPASVSSTFSFNTMTTLNGSITFEGNFFDTVEIYGYSIEASGGIISLQCGTGGFYFSNLTTHIAGNSPVEFNVQGTSATSFNILTSGNTLILETDVHINSATGDINNLSIGGTIDCGTSVLSINNINLVLLNTAKVLTAHTGGFQASMPGTTYAPSTIIEYNGITNQMTGMTNHFSPVGTMIINNPAGVGMDNTLQIGILSLQTGEFNIGGQTLEILGTIENSGGFLAGDIAASVLKISEPAFDLIQVNTNLQLSNFVINAQNAQVELLGPGRLYTQHTQVQNGQFLFDGAELDITGSLVITGGSLIGGPNAGLFIGPAVDPFDLFSPGQLEFQLDTFKYERPYAFTLNGDLIIENLLNLADGEIFIDAHTLYLNGSYESQGGVIGGTDASTLAITAANSNGDGMMLTFNETDNKNTLGNFSINRPGEVIDVLSSLSVTNLSFSGGKLKIVDGDLIVSTVSGANELSYIMTGGSGTLSNGVTSAGSNIILPIGTFLHYSPLTLIPENTDVFKVRVKDSVLVNGYGGHAINNPGIVHLTWEVLSETDAGAFSLNLSWPPAAEGTEFDQSNAYLANYDINQNQWVNTTVSSFDPGTVGSFFATGINDFGLFAISSVPLINNPPLARDTVFTIQEHTPNGTVIGKLNVRDPDPDQAVTINLLEGPVLNPFELNENFEIVVIDEVLLEFDDHQSFKYNLEVCDNGFPQFLCTPFTVTVNLIEIIGEGDIFISNYISPNHDGYNDTWVIRVADPSQIDVFIYNNSGNLVFESKGYTTQWDGTAKGKLLPAGVYFYIIRSGNDEYKGTITLVR